MHKMLEENRARERKAEVERSPVQKQPEAKIQDKKDAPREKKSNKLFPHSALFKEWGENLSEDDQREAQGLFENYGYNVFLSDHLPLDRALPETRDPRYSFHDSFPVIPLSLTDCTKLTVCCIYPPPCCPHGLSLDKAFPQLTDAKDVLLFLNRCLKKSYPKDLPSLGVVLIYLNEALSIIKRALRSIIDRTPKNLLKEIIMVDDNSSNGWLVAKGSDCANPRVINKSSFRIYRLHS